MKKIVHIGIASTPCDARLQTSVDKLLRFPGTIWNFTLFVRDPQLYTACGENPKEGEGTCPMVLAVSNGLSTPQATALAV